MGQIILIFIVGLNVGMAMVWFLVLRKEASKRSVKGGDKGVGKLVEFNKNRLDRQAENKQKILDFLGQKGKLSNKDVEKLLLVSDATATRYLDELESVGAVSQVGKKGRFVYYKLVKK